MYSGLASSAPLLQKIRSCAVSGGDLGESDRIDKVTGQASMPTMAPTYIKILINKNVHNSVPKPQEAMELKLLALPSSKTAPNACSESLL